MTDKQKYDLLKKQYPTWSDAKLKAAVKEFKVLESGLGGAAIAKALINFAKTFKKPTKKQVVLGAGALGLGGLAVQGGGDSGTPDVAQQTNTDLMMAAAQYEAAGGDINALANTAAGQQLFKNPNFSLSSILNSGSLTVGNTGVYTGEAPPKDELRGLLYKPRVVSKEFISLTDWKNQFPIADPKALAKWKATLVSSGVVGAGAGLGELKQQWEAWGQASQDLSRSGKKLTPYQLLDIQRGLWGGGGGGGGNKYETSYQVNLLKGENVKSVFKAAREQEAGAIVGDKAAAAFAETVKAKQLAKPTKTEYKKIKGKMTPVVTQGYGEAEATAEALALAKKDPLYAEFQTANVFGSALEKALGVRG